MSTRLWWGGLIVALLIPAIVPTPAAAARPLSFAIELDGKEHLFARGGDDGEGRPADVWRRLSFTELSPVGDAQVKSDPGDPLRATLRGDITIDVSHGGKATVKELHLVRKSPATGWTVDSRDVDQIAHDIGLDNPPAATAPAPPATEPAAATKQSPWVWIGAGLAMSLFASGFLVTWLRRRLPPPARFAGPAEVPFADPE